MRMQERMEKIENMAISSYGNKYSGMAMKLKNPLF